VFGVWCLVFGVWCLVFGVWCLVFGVWCLVFGIWFLMNLNFKLLYLNSNEIGELQSKKISIINARQCDFATNKMTLK
jgi:hypothetical protein